MNREFLQARLDSTLRQIEAYESAIEAFAGESIASYSLDTGQGKTSVTRANLTEMHNALDRLYNRAAVIEVRMNRSGAIIGVPAW